MEGKRSGGAGREVGRVERRGDGRGEKGMDEGGVVRGTGMGGTGSKW